MAPAPAVSAPAVSAPAAAVSSPATASRQQAAQALAALLAQSGTDRAAITQAFNAVAGCSAGLGQDETIFSIDLVSLLVRDARARLEVDGTIGSVPAPVRAQLADELDQLTERYRDRWLARNRPGGLSDSLAWLSNLRGAYESGRPEPTWGGLAAPR